MDSDAPDEQALLKLYIREASFEKPGKYFLTLALKGGEQRRTDVTEESSTIGKFKERKHEWPLAPGSDPAHDGQTGGYQERQQRDDEELRGQGHAHGHVYERTGGRLYARVPM